MTYLILMALCEVVLMTTISWLRPINYSKTLSVHIASLPQTIQIGRVLLPVIGVLLALWSASIAMPFFLRALLWVMSGAFVIMGMVPYTGSRRSKLIHDFAAWGSAPIMLIIEVLSVLQFSAAAGAIIPIIALQITILCAFLLHKSSRKWITLIGQAVFFAGFTTSLFIVRLVAGL